MGTFIIYQKTGAMQWPMELYADEESPKAMTTLDEVEGYLQKHQGLFTRNHNRDEARKFTYKSQITSIYGPIAIPSNDNLMLEDVLTLNEAASRWPNIKTVGTIRTAIAANRFREEEVRKSDSIWLVTYGGMVRLYGPEDPYAYDALLLQQAVFENGKFIWDVKNERVDVQKTNRGE